VRTKLAAVGVALLLAACGGSDRAETVQPETSTRQVPGNPRQALLALEDLPAGWTTSPDPVGGAGGRGGGLQGAFPPCGKTLPSATEPVWQKGVAFGKSALGPSLSQWLYIYDEGEGPTRFDQILAAFGSCEVYRARGSTITVKPLSFPKVGDETQAIRFLQENRQGFQSEFDYVRWRYGDTSTTLLVGGISADTKLTSRLVRRADEKLRRAL
jgi:hypothetical protein